MGYHVVPPPYLAQLFVTRDTGDGWSENYWCMGADYDAAMGHLQSIGAARLTTLSPEFNIVALRISAANAKRDTTIRTSGTGTGTGSYAGGGGTVYTLPSENAIQCRFIGDATGWTIRQFRGIPTTVVKANGHVDYTVTDFFSPFNAFLIVVETESVLVVKGVAPAVYRTIPIVTIQTKSTFSRRKVGRPFGLSRGRALIR